MCSHLAPDSLYFCVVTCPGVRWGRHFCTIDLTKLDVAVLANPHSRVKPASPKCKNVIDREGSTLVQLIHVVHHG